MYYLISREDAISAIKQYCEGCDNYNGVRCRACDFYDAITAIYDCKIVDAVEVVRCNDCKYLKRVGNVGGFCRNEDIMRIRINYDFCSKGVKIDLEEE